nr:Chain K, Crystal structure of Thermotoga maritima encapsulin [Thermotoga maritima]3DKT_L Chain L, Crystal structure of Thermotoga maritima encapsulin [Thermotoga maritima]3DKT_M Chain M, Crystal structure of Thermotoga maritima encapsulin [Thermotoga maritima]3DKT_N Chain N, Crystal structure of Thermotoga maritima encapsulin [Thermotoga maritima]3DKT_O Chain O, Crystal structure of Thermotoga maritima encapsulin [Thermotoga maritima]3DKT_P Chain P, Crystal structure of Thermotoga maritima 
GGDLGIRK